MSETVMYADGGFGGAASRAGFSEAEEFEARAAAQAELQREAELADAAASEEVFVEGFSSNGSFARAGMSATLQASIARQEAEEAAQIAREQRERKVLAEDFRERNVQAAIADAVERGEQIDMPAVLRGRGRGLGHTPSEFVAIISARQDVEDAQREARQAKAFQLFQAGLTAVPSMDTTAPTQLAIEAGHAEQARTEFYLDRKRQREMAVAEARREAKAEHDQTLRLAVKAAALMDRSY